MTDIASFPRKLPTLAGIVLASLLLFPVLVSAEECPLFPDVPWWKGLSHESVRLYVDSKNQGNWQAYLFKWEKQLKLVQNVYDRGSVVQVSKDKIRLQGKQLLAYKKNIEKRLKVIRCLAGLNISEEAKKPPKDAANQEMVRNDPDAGREKANEAGCHKCHGNDGMSIHPAVPNLAGQNDWYIVKQLKEFQIPLEEDDEAPIGTIARHNSIMSPRALELSESDVWNLAAFYSSQMCRDQKRAEQTPMEAPERSQSCIRCHGMAGKSVFPEVPNLAGQNRNFMIKQLTAYRKSAQLSGPIGQDQRYHYGMTEEARTLSDTEIEQLAGFFSGLSCQ